MIELHTLGDAVIKVGTKEIRPTSPMVFAALLYLCVERGRRVPRAALQELLFPESDERSGAHSLRQLLYKLRRLGVPLDTNGAAVSISTSVRTDDQELLTSEVSSILPTHIALGPLAGYAIRVSESYDEWLDAYRSSVIATIRRRLVRALSEARDALDWQRVDALAKSVLASDPLNEEATCALAEAAAATGNKIRAVAMLGSYEREAGAKGLTVSASILRRRISETPDVHRPGDVSFKGRERDSGAIIANLLRRDETPSVVLVCGEPGIGKTRLLEETAQLAHMDGIGFHIIRCEPNHVLRSLGVIIDLVGNLLSSPGALGVSPEALDALRSMMSRGIERPTGIQDVEARLGVLQWAMGDLVDAVLAEGPMVIAVEDIHWSDTPSLTVLQALFRRRSQPFARFLFTSRDARLPDQLKGLTEFTTTHWLGPLDESVMNELCEAILAQLGTHATEREVRWIVENTGGNPLFLKMLCAHYADTGQAFSAPKDLTAAIATRLHGLPSESRRLLEYCALLKNRGTLKRLIALTQSSHSDLVDAIQALETAGFIRLRNDSVVVSHDLLRECVQALIPPATKSALHYGIAHLLDGTYQNSRDVAQLWECAEHWELSGAADEAVDSLIECANHAMGIGFSPDALKLLERARAVSHAESRLASTLSATAYCYRTMGDWQSVKATCEHLRAVDPQRLSAHNDDEFLDMESLWFTKLDPGDSPSRLLSCVTSDTSSVTHKLEALCLGLKIATELCDATYAHRIYGLGRAVLDAHPQLFLARLAEIVFHTGFGDRAQAMSSALALAAELPSMTFPQQLRAATSVSIVQYLMGDVEGSLSTCRAYYEKALALGIDCFQQEYADRACCCSLDYDDHALADLWHEKAEDVVHRSPDRLSWFHEANAIEIAIAKRDRASATAHLRRLPSDSRNSLRFGAYLLGIEIRVQQLDPAYRCTDECFTEMNRLHVATRAMFSADGLAQAVAEELLRRGQGREATRVLREFLHVRRELTRPTAAFRHLLSIAGVPWTENPAKRLSA